eukprot:CAMPEP_0172433734 /NCGR_PEP_ID=MMETSP1064-20121228/69404_1 /TAXON_ID=202472 /ORGANISM="Aulacoseira subarctica , Strain CCAP 1002/5" /LENGTH=69 /DNA_ID=CAMNT_0013181815 /DNA_START=218 /DNA_END=427 /DNA_ORIENTATION=+
MALAFDEALKGLLFTCIRAIILVQRDGDAFVDDSHFGATSTYRDDENLSMDDNLRLHELQVTEDLQKLA